MLQIVVKKLKKSGFLPTVLWFLFIAAIVFIISYRFQFNSQTPYFTGEDSFYHVGMAKLMMSSGIFIQHFPYLNFTIINNKFVDSHYLFHLLLIPFIKIFGEVIGPKILVLTLFSAIFGIVYLIFKERKLKLAPLYALILFFVMPEHFYLRMSFIRDPVFSLFLMLLSVFFLLKKKPWALAITMFIYAWSYYVGAVLIFFLFLAYLITPIFTGEKINYKLVLFGLGGYLCGIIINPYFPQNISFFFIQAFSAGFSTGDFWGSEHAPYDAWYWFTSSLSAVLLFFGGITFTFLKRIRQDAFSIAFFIFTVFILILEWKSRRFAEYWPLLGGISGILLCGKYLEETLISIIMSLRLQACASARQSIFKPEKIAVIILIVIFLEVSFFTSLFSFSNTFKDVGTDQNVDGLKEASVYLKNNSDSKDMVFNDTWSMFPYLFYFNQKDYYIVGLDPSFLKDYDQKLFDEYYALTFDNDSARSSDANLIKTDFKAKWAIISSEHGTLKSKVEAFPGVFEKKFENNSYTIYKVL